MQKPTEKELEILNIIWDLGSASVKQVHEILTKSKEVGYTTILKFMQILTEKGMLVYNKSHKHHIYSPVFSREYVQRHYLKSVIENLFQGSTSSLVLNAIDKQSLNPKEIEKIKFLLAKLEANELDN